jgi:hypothetical protein
MEKVLFTRQRHEADRAGLHWDYRLVVGGVAHSWATKKELPKPGESIMLWQQPIHTVEYALARRIVIPKGMYGSGVTTLDWVKKGDADLSKDKIVIRTDDGRFLLKRMPKYEKGDGWLFKNLGKEEIIEKKANEMNKYLTKISDIGKNLNYNFNALNDLESSEFYDRLLLREANRILLENKYKPILNYTPRDISRATGLEDEYSKKDKRPHEVSANRWGTLGGLVNGASAAFILNKLAPITTPTGAAVAIAGGLLGAYGGFSGTKNILYNDAQKVEDTAKVTLKNKSFQEYLKKRFQRE